MSRITLYTAVCQRCRPDTDWAYRSYSLPDRNKWVKNHLRAHGPGHTITCSTFDGLEQDPATRNTRVLAALRG